MSSTQSPPIDRETLVRTVRTTIDAARGRLMSMNKFLTASGLKKRDIYNHFATWSELVREAGYRITSSKSREPDELLADWGRVVRKLRRRPTEKEYRLHGGKYATVTFRRHFSDWNRVADAFRDLAAKEAGWESTLPFTQIAAPEPAYGQRRGGRRPRHAVKTGRRIPSRPACGMALDFGALRHEPMNEQGVTFAFGMMAAQLGFMVESFQSAYPDCQAKRRIHPIGWQQVAIEFEYESRNFRDHRHPPEGCDIIVCWRHNWPDCPKNIEVIALSEEIKRLAPGKPALTGPVPA